MTGMEFASEMVVKAALRGIRVAEVPVVLSPDGRGRPPHLRPWRDGWRHLKFLLMHSPRWLYLYPGLAMAGGGLGAMTILALVKLNPQVAARMATAFRSWAMLEEKRQGLAKAQLERILATPGLSRDLFEIASKSLGANG